MSLLLVGCPPTDLSAAPPLRAPPAPRRVAYFTDPSLRCGECHEKLVDDWHSSAHAQAAANPAFQRAAQGQQGCQRCHEPLAGRAELAVASEGVTCDVCHSLRETKDAGFELDLTDRVKFGPLCDAEDHHFHKMGCSPGHLTSALCKTCHQWVRGTLPILTEYDEWLASDAFAQDRMCQDCHMPTESAEVAVGSTARKQVGHHQLFGPSRGLRKQALSLTVNLLAVGDGYQVETLLTNDGAGHSVPTGFPGRQIELKVSSRETSTVQSRLYSRVLGADGVELAFMKATAVLSDNRIAAGATTRELFPLAAGVKHVEVEVTWRQFSPALASAFGVSAPREEALLRAAFDVPQRGRAGGKPRLVKTVMGQEVKFEVPH